jgi:hypothetical protein
VLGTRDISCILKEDTYVLDQCTLMLEGFTLAEVVQLVVKMFVDLPLSRYLTKRRWRTSESSHPEDLAGRTGAHICVVFVNS